jgi:hypothetical protein
MFDPYHKWLGIPKDQRPPTYYQLLGISPAETDAEVIDEAAIRQTSHIRTYQIGPHSLECTQILNEISQARTTLLSPPKRKEYDASLAAKAAAYQQRAESGRITGAPAPILVPFAGLDEEDALLVRKHSSARRRRSRSVAKEGVFLSKPILYGLIGGGVALVILIALGLVLLVRGSKRPTANPAQVHNVDNHADNDNQEDTQVKSELPPIAKAPAPAIAEKMKQRQGWGKFIDPDRDCRVLEEAGRLKIIVPGTIHNLNPTPAYANVSAPRVLHDVTGDFHLQVRVLPFPRPAARTALPGKRSYVGAGLVIWQDSRTFIRFLRAANGDTNWLAASAEAFQDGKMKGDGSRLIDDIATYLRIERKGDMVTYATSADGQNWADIRMPPLKLAAQLKVGVAATNSTIREISPEFEELTLKVDQDP